MKKSIGTVKWFRFDKVGYINVNDKSIYFESDLKFFRGDLVHFETVNILGREVAKNVTKVKQKQCRKKKNENI